MRKNIITSFILFLAIFFTAGAQTNIYVSNRGSDSNAGSFKKPLKSLGSALKIANKHGDEVTIYLREGIYYLDSTLLIDSGSFMARSLTITNYKNEPVVISGGKNLKLAWTPYQNGIYQAKVPSGIEFDQLFVNDVKKVIARYPNYDASSRILKGTAADAISKDRIKKWNNPMGGYLHGLQAHQWGSLHYLISGKNADGILQLEGGWQNNRPSELHKEYRYVENIFEELDTASEWFLDKQKHILYYYPTAGLNLEKASIIVSQLKNSIELRGTSQKPLTNVHFRGINFAHNSTSFMETKEPLLRSDWRIYRGGILLFENTENCSVEDCNFYNAGGNAVMVSGFNKNTSIHDSHFYQLGANAICFVGKEKAVRSSINKYEGFISYNQLDKTTGPLSNDYPQNCIADNNLIHDIGLIEKQVAGININIASDIKVSHNTIYNVPRAGINIGDGCFGGHIIEFNSVFNTVQETGDHGAFNSWGRDRFWNANRAYMDSLVAVHPELILLDVQKKIILRNNTFHCDHGWDIDLDDGSSNYEIYNNICLGGGIKFREGFYRKGYNNIMVNNTFHPHVWFYNSHDSFERNIVMKPYQPIRVPAWGDKVDDNLFLTEADLLAAQANGTDKHSTFGTPGFVNPAEGNYTVSNNSPALKIGFKNFPMDAFGVQKPSLKKIAVRPPFPKLISEIFLSSETKDTEFSGIFLKSVNGAGDRSAYGLADETGVIILSLKGDDIFSKAGFQANDVIRQWEEIPVKDVNQFIRLVKPLLNSGKTISIQIIRNQQQVIKKLKM